jgi:hypothetical protein
MGEYSIGSDSRIVLESELIVTSFTANAEVPPLQDESWWAPTMGTKGHPSDLAALEASLGPDRTVISPLSSVPAGFAAQSSVVYTNPYDGSKTAVLSYSDGLDVLFVQQTRSVLAAQPSGRARTPGLVAARNDVISFMLDGSLTVCRFEHGGVSYQVVGRTNQSQDVVRKLSREIFAAAIDAARR